MIVTAELRVDVLPEFGWALRWILMHDTRLPALVMAAPRRQQRHREAFIGQEGCGNRTRHGQADLKWVKGIDIIMVHCPR